MNLSIYLNFDGNCREAFEFYRSVFGGEFLTIAAFSEGPEDMPVADEEKDRIMHVSLPVGESVLMGSDTSTSQGPPFQEGNNFSVSCHPQTKEEVDRYFAAMSEGGMVVMPPADMFWGSYFGMCVDKFGVSWQFNCDLLQQE